MTTLIHVAVPVPNEDLVGNTVVNCCLETGDIPIGRRVYEEFGEVLIVIRLVQDYNMSKHVSILSEALQGKLILSFQIEMTNLVAVHCSPPSDIRSFTQHFPLHSSESWFPAIKSPQLAYICTRRLILQPDQESWFDRYHLDYKYI